MITYPMIIHPYFSIPMLIILMLYLTNEVYESYKPSRFEGLVGHQSRSDNWYNKYNSKKEFEQRLKRLNDELKR